MPVMGEMSRLRFDALLGAAADMTVNARTLFTNDPGKFGPQPIARRSC